MICVTVATCLGGKFYIMLRDKFVLPAVLAQCRSHARLGLAVVLVGPHLALACAVRPVSYLLFHCRLLLVLSVLLVCICMTSCLGVKVEEQHLRLRNVIRSAQDKLDADKRKIKGLPAGAAALLTGHWQRLSVEADRLCWSSSALRASLGSIPFAAELAAAMPQGRELARTRLTRYANVTCKPEEHLSSVLKLGCGPPGYSGCLSVDGTGIKWSVFTSKSTGILTAMRALGLSLVGLPGARLADSFRLPAIYGLSCYSRGGPSYASCAIVWWSFLDNVILPIKALGSDRRLWVRVGDQSHRTLYWCVYYLPSGHGGEIDDAWCREVDVLENDIERLIDMTSDAQDVQVGLSGDANAEPSLLGGGRDFSAKRDRRWAQLMSKFNLQLANPPLTDPLHLQRIWLPLRKRFVDVACGHTHHSSERRSRAIDLVAASPGLSCSVVVHNSVHCGQDAPCPFSRCLEYTLGDHFLLEVLVEGVHVPSSSPPLPRMPRWWHSPVQWQCGLDAAEDILVGVRGCLAEGRSFAVRSAKDNGCSRDVAQWCVDAVAWVIELLMAFIRDVWVVPVGNPSGRSDGRRGVSTGGLDINNGGSWERQMQDAIEGGQAPRSLIHKCYRWLRPALPRPPGQLQANGTFCSVEETHKIWCEQVVRQREWTYAWDKSFHDYVCERVASLVGHAWVHRGSGQHDADVLESEALAGMHGWDSSDALTPDLIPRCVFHLRHRMFDSIVWLAMSITGPGGLALRPLSWRKRCMVPLFKCGEVFDVDSWRLLEVPVQMGLLQETVLANRVRPRMLQHLYPGQSGFLRDVSDPQLVLHEVLAVVRESLRSAWLAPSDLWKAFPHTWRDGLLLLIHEGPRLRDGVFALLGSTLEFDVVLVNQAGSSEVLVTEGVPEGGLVGPLAFTQLPDVLVKDLHECGFGIGVDVSMPAEWEGHQWVGCGTPEPAAVEVILEALHGHGVLPSCDALESSACLEASALRALDRTASIRIAALLHADDPLFVDSTRGGLQGIMDRAALWAYRFKAAFHLGAAKNVVQVAGEAAHAAASSSLTPVFFNPPCAPPSSLAFSSQHKWLGFLLRPDLDLRPALLSRIRAAESKFLELSGLVSCGILPLWLALDMFETKVDGVLRPGRWLLAIAWDAKTSYNDAFESWARSLLGSQRWRSGAVATGELGWRLSGFDRAIVDLASRRARLWNLPACDLYAGVFRAAHGWPGATWSKVSLALLDDHGILDWPCWAGPGSSVKAYVKYVRGTLRSSHLIVWKASAEKHVHPFPYLLLREEPSSDAVIGHKAVLSWGHLLAARSVSRIRAGLLHLGHRGGRRTAARLKQCIACGQTVSDTYVHCLAICAAFSSERGAAVHTLGLVDGARRKDVAMQLLKLRASDRAYPAALHLAHSISLCECNFWRCTATRI